jgi:hypothetical protein
VVKTKTRILHSAAFINAWTLSLLPSHVCLHEVQRNNFLATCPFSPDDDTLYRNVFDGQPLSLMCSGVTRFLHITVQYFIDLRYFSLIYFNAPCHSLLPIFLQLLGVVAYSIQLPFYIPRFSSAVFPIQHAKLHKCIRLHCSCSKILAQM